MVDESIPAGELAKILVVDDVAENRRLLLETLEPVGYSVSVAPSGEVALRVAKANPPDLVLLDVMMPGMNGYETCAQLHAHPATGETPVIFVTAKSDLADMIEGFEAGGVDYITKPVQTEEVLIRVRTHLKIHSLKRELQRKNEVLQSEIAQRKRAEEKVSELSEREADRWGLKGYIGQSDAFKTTSSEIERLTRFPKTNVLITGESGTGKELVARAIHYGSESRENSFVAVNCAAIPRDLVESSFFGHVKGAFSGASSDKRGYFQEADGGSLFLDEIGDMPQDMQAKLLRALEEQIVVPVGSAKERPVKVRVLSGTNADLRAEVEEGRFRKDLYFRLAGYAIELRPLRERDGDIPLLAAYFLDRFRLEMGMGSASIDREALKKLEVYDYPGNVRELKNLIERALIESGGGVVLPEHLRFQFEKEPAYVEPENPPEGVSLPGKFRKDSDESRIIEFVMNRGCINNSDCRELLGVGLHRACYLLRKLHRNGIVVRDHSRKSANYRIPETS